MRINQRFQRNAGLAILLLHLVSRSHAASTSDPFPPSGNYRVDSESSLSHLQNGTGVTSRENGTTGDTSGRTHSPDDAGADRLYRGDAPLWRCVKPAPTPAAATIAAAPLLAGCRDQSSTATADGVVMKATCAAGAITTTIRRIDPLTWEYEYVTSVGQPAGGPDATAMRPMLENMAKNAPDPVVREKAAMQLARLPQLQRQMTQQQSAVADMYVKAEREAKSPADAARIRAAAERHAGGKQKMEMTRKERWTRVAGSC